MLSLERSVYAARVTSTAPQVPLTVGRWLTGWSVDLPTLVTVLIVGGLYVAGLRRVRSCGVRWSTSSTTWFLLAGCGSWLLVTCSFLGTYSRVLFWPLAVQDVLLMTLVPIGLTLGRPVALFRAARSADPAGPVAAQPARGVLVRIASFPLTGSVVAVCLLLAIYTTRWDQARLEHPWLLDTTRVALLVAGCAFLWPLLGVDDGPSRTSYPVRAIIAFLDGLLDALPGLAVLGTGHVIAAGYYNHAHRSWGPSVEKAQQIGGTAMIALSELVGLPALLVLLVAWVRSDAMQARELDAALDAVTAAEQAAVGGGSDDAQAGREERELTQRPWWEINAGPLADRAQRHGWTQESATSPPPEPDASGG